MSETIPGVNWRYASNIGASFILLVVLTGNYRIVMRQMDKQDEQARMNYEFEKELSSFRKRQLEIAELLARYQSSQVELSTKILSELQLQTKIMGMHNNDIDSGRNR